MFADAMTPTEPHTYVVAGMKPWNRRTFDRRLGALPGTWRFAATTEELDRALVLPPRYVFFLHWSRKVPATVTTTNECVVFHMTDVPYGRGGTPLQNLVLRGHRRTMLTALRMTEDIDAGPVYAKQPLDLGGTAEEVYLRADALAASMIEDIVTTEPQPVAQDGDVVRFERRGPDQSQLPGTGDLDTLVSFIQMLDADGYPAAFVDHGPYRLELRRAARYDERVEADVRITIRDQGR